MPRAKDLKAILDSNSLIQKPSLSIAELIKRLKKISSILKDINETQQPQLKHISEELASNLLLKHKNGEVRLLVACCLADILRIYVPDPPYNEKILKNILKLFIDLLYGIIDTTNVLFEYYFYLLESLVVLRTLSLLIEFQFDDLLLYLFNKIFEIINFGLPPSTEHRFNNILTSLFEEMDDISFELLESVLTHLVLTSSSTTKEESDKTSNKEYTFACSIVERCQSKLEPFVVQYIRTGLIEKRVVSERRASLQLVSSICAIAPDMLLSLSPHLQDMTTVEDNDERLSYVTLFGEMFTGSGDTATAHLVVRKFDSLFKSFLQRFNDADPTIRIKMCEMASDFLIVHYPKFTDVICNYLITRSQDPEERVRLTVVRSTCEAAINNPAAVTLGLISAVGRRTLDKKIKVQTEALSKLALLFRAHGIDSWKLGQPLTEHTRKFSWIPRKLILSSPITNSGAISMISTYVENIFEQKLLDPRFSPQEYSRCLLAIFLSLDDTSSKMFERRWFKEKKNFQSMINRLIENRRNLDIDPNNARMKQSRSHLMRRLHNALPATSSFEDVTSLFEHKNKKVIKYIEILANPVSTREHIYAARKNLVSAVGTGGSKKQRGADMYQSVKETASRLSIAAACGLVSIDVIPELIDLARENLITTTNTNSRLAIGALKLLSLCSFSFPSMLLPSIDKILSFEADIREREIEKEEVDVIIELWLEILARVASTMEEEKSEISSRTLKCPDQLLPHLEKFCISGSVRQAKFSVRCIHLLYGIKAPQFIEDVLMKCLVELHDNHTDLPHRHLLAVLSSLCQIAREAPDIFIQEREEVISFISTELLSSLDNKKKKTKEVDSILVETQVLGIKVLARLLMASYNDVTGESTVSLVAPILFSFLSNTNNHDYTSSSLTLAAANALIKICSISHFKSLFLTPEHTQQLVLVAHSDSVMVRHKFLLYVMHRMFTNKLHFRFVVFLALAASDADDSEFKNKIQKALVTLIHLQRRYNDQMILTAKAAAESQSVATDPQILPPEFYLSDLIHILAHHPDYEHNVEGWDFCQQFLIFFMDALLQDMDATHHNFAYLFSLLQEVRNSEDVLDPDNSRNVRALAELSTLYLKRKQKGKKGFTHTLFPGQISLRQSYYRQISSVRKEIGTDVAVSGSYLPLDYKLAGDEKKRSAILSTALKKGAESDESSSSESEFKEEKKKQKRAPVRKKLRRKVQTKAKPRRSLKRRGAVRKPVVSTRKRTRAKKASITSSGNDSKKRDHSSISSSESVEEHIVPKKRVLPSRKARPKRGQMAADEQSSLSESDDISSMDVEEEINFIKDEEESQAHHNGNNKRHRSDHNISSVEEETYFIEDEEEQLQSQPHNLGNNKKHRFVQKDLQKEEISSQLEEQQHQQSLLSTKSIPHQSQSTHLFHQLFKESESEDDIESSSSSTSPLPVDKKKLPHNIEHNLPTTRIQRPRRGTFRTMIKPTRV